MTRLFRNVAYSIQRVTLLLAEGGTELLQVTARHSFWVEGAGWTPAELLLAGQTVLTADGQAATVLGSETVAHPAGIVVYNFSVEGDHTYFVDDGLGDIAAVWVHNKRRPRLPKYVKGGPTSGWLRTSQGDTPLVSGWAGPAARMPKGTPGMNIVTKSHVEAHAAAIMREQGLQRATLYINRVPCSGKRGCRALLPRMLPKNARLRVIGPRGFDRTFVGV